MQPYWMTFADRTGACAEAESDVAAKAIAKERLGKDAVTCAQIPYPAMPRLTEHVYVEGYGPCPPFCYSPGQCSGRSSCPKNYACSE